MTKPKPKAPIVDVGVIRPPLPELVQSVVQPSATLPDGPPTLSISESVANEFIKDIQKTALPSINEYSTPATLKANLLVNNLVKRVKASTATPRKPKSQSQSQNQSPDDPDSKASLIGKITINANAFEPLLVDHLLPSKDAYLQGLSKRSEDDLVVQLRTLEYARTVGNLTNQMKHLTYLGVSTVELFGAKVGLKTQGYADAVKAQEREIQMILKEVAMERAEQWGKAQRPELRLAMVLANTLLAIDNHNRSRALQTAQINESTSKKFADL
jgi:hypothetical protein